jgi:acyl-CoA thioester hydrolase
LTFVPHLVYILGVPRIKLLEQPVYEFQYELIVQVGHLNYAGHLGHDSVVNIAHEARVHMFHALGVAENNLDDGKTGTIIGDLAVSYSSEGHLFDKLRIQSHIGELGRTNFRVFQRLTREGGLVALVETGSMAFDYSVRAIVPIPDAFRKALKRHLMTQILNSNI